MRTIDLFPYVKLPLRVEVDPRDGTITIIEADGGVLMSDHSNDTPDGAVEWMVRMVNDCAAAQTELRTRTKDFVRLIEDAKALMRPQGEWEEDVERLRAALQQIAAGNPSTTGKWLTDVEMADIARAALKQ